MELENEVKSSIINHCTSHDPMLGQSVEMILKTMPFENIAKFVDLLKPILNGPASNDRPQNTNRLHTTDKLFGFGSYIPYLGQRYVPDPLREGDFTRRRRRRRRARKPKRSRANSYRYGQRQMNHDEFHDRPQSSTPLIYNMRGGSININGSVIFGQQDDNYPPNTHLSFSQPQDTDFQYMYERWVRR